MEEEEKVEEVFVSEAKIKKLRNLKMFRDWTDEQIIDWVRTREKNTLPPKSPKEITTDAPKEAQEALAISEAEYKTKFKKYMTRYKRELGVDLNNANDAETLRAMVRYAIQLDLVNDAINKEQSKASPYPQTLKGLGDFQRTVQQNINESQDRLGVSRKQRKDREGGNDITEYVTTLKAKAKDFWERKTVAIRCEKCKIELARYWLNFPDTVISDGTTEITMPAKITAEIYCDRCKEKVLYIS